MASIEETSPGHGFAAYRRVLAVPGITPILAASVVARLPVGMGAVALVLYVHGATGSFAAAGIAAGAFTVGLGVTGPLLARVIDRYGTRPVVLPGGLLSSAALVGVVALGHADAGAAPMALAAFVAGGAAVPLGSVTRIHFGLKVGEHDMPTAYALDAILLESFFIIGPLLAGILAATVGAGDGLLVAAAIGVVGNLWFAAVGHIGPTHHPEHERHWAGAMVSPGIRLLVITGIPLGVTFGALDVALPAFGAIHGNSALGGPMAATLALGSAAGGIVYGLRPHLFGPPLRTFLTLSVLQALTCVPILIGAGVPQMFLAAGLAGICVAPLGTVRNQLVQRLAPAGTMAEAFTWMGLSITVGASAGAAVAGPLVQAAGWRAGALVACIIPATGALLAFGRRDALRVP